ncbi:hypothetical protein D6Z49_15425 [Escherichia coli]|nr:hypothetical protein [Escherichia coli]EHQ3208274.1 hypothetical protein [Salmonella enterica]
MATENKSPASADTLDRTLRILSEAGSFEGREDIVLFLASQGYQVERLNKDSIDIISPMNEKYHLYGTLYSAGNNKIFNRLHRGLWGGFWLALLAAFVSRVLWSAVFEAITSPAQSEFWLSLPDDVRTDLNMWGYLVPPLFISVSVTLYVMLILISVARYLKGCVPGRFPLYLRKGEQ